MFLNIFLAVVFLVAFVHRIFDIFAWGQATDDSPDHVQGAMILWTIIRVLFNFVMMIVFIVRIFTQG